MNKPILKSDLEFIANQCSKEFDILSGNTIFITGGTGFFGKWLLEAFNHANQSLTQPIKLHVLTRSPDKFEQNYPNILNENITLIKGSLTNFDIDNSCRYFLHAATDVASALTDNSVEAQSKAAISSTEYLINKLENSSVKNFLFTSSGAVYGSKDSSMKPSEESETLRLNQTTAYGEAKILSEELLSNKLDQMKINLSIARCFAFVGAHLPTEATFAAGNFIKNLLNEENIIIKGNGAPQRTFMYMADLCTWLIKLLVNNQGTNIINVGSDEVIDIRALADSISSHSSNCNVEVLGVASEGPVPSYVPNIKKAKNDFGLVNHYNFNDSIHKTIEWFKQ